jgi:hypothetical protein
MEETTLGAHANGVSSRLGQQTQHEERRGGSAIAKDTCTVRPVSVKAAAVVSFRRSLMEAVVSRRKKSGKSCRPQVEGVARSRGWRASPPDGGGFVLRRFGMPQTRNCSGFLF